MIRTFFLSSLLAVVLGDFQFRQARAQVVWKPIETPKAQPSPVIWETTIPDSVKPGQPSRMWEVVPEPENQSQPPSVVVWEKLETEDEAFIPPSKTASKSVVTPPSSL